MFHLTVFIALLLSYCLSLASAIPFERRTTGVITQCTVPNTVALTFVRRSCCHLFMRLTFYFPCLVFLGRRSIQISRTKTTYSSCRHKPLCTHSCVFKGGCCYSSQKCQCERNFLFQFVKRLTFYSLLVSFSDYFPFRFRWKQLFVYSSHLFSGILKPN